MLYAEENHLDRAMRVFYSLTGASAMVAADDLTVAYRYPHACSAPVDAVSDEPCADFPFVCADGATAHLLVDLRGGSALSAGDLQLLCQIFCSHIRQYVHGTDTPRFSAVRRYILDHPAADLSAAALSARFHTSRSALFRMAKRSTGLTLGTFVCRSRLEYAARLLLETDLPVAEIALLCGMLDANYFTLQFRKRYGMPPTAYRKNGAFLP